MATELPSEAIKKVDKLYSESNRGANAEVILRLLDPLVEERLALLLNKFQQCPPELGPLLDLRAMITETWRMRKELKDAVKLGKSAQSILEGLMLKNQRPESGQN